MLYCSATFISNTSNYVLRGQNEYASVIPCLSLVLGFVRTRDSLIMVIFSEVADKQRRLVEVDVNFIEEITVSHARRE